MNTAEQNKQNEANNLLPVFMKLEQMKVLLVGAGNVALEKLRTIQENAPQTRICVVAKEISHQFAEYAATCRHVEVIKDNYAGHYLKKADVVFSAVNDHALSAQIFADAQLDGKLCNSADKPDFCHFYLSSVVSKGDLKIAISTNGKSPTMAKRLKEILQNSLPHELEDVVKDMHLIRGRLEGNFEMKVQRLREITRILVEQTDGDGAVRGIPSPLFGPLWKKFAAGILFALFFMLTGHGIFSVIPLESWIAFFRDGIAEMNYQWVGIMFMTGFMAQFVDSMLGMGFGVISTTVLLSLGVNPAILSSRVHSARVFTSAFSGYSHHKFGNVNMPLFRMIVIPGSIGAIIGATLACVAGEKHAYWVRPLLSIYTLYLGVRIFGKAFIQTQGIGKIRKAGWLATAGGMLDAFAGSGWGSLVTSTLLSKSKNPRMVIGSVCLAEFFVMLASTLTFFILLRHVPIQDVTAMIAGGLVAAPVSASLTGKLPHKYLFLFVGSLVMLSSLRTLWRALL
jgi:uncharacterized protein